jgi:membrane associated rhomboid family serine protease
MVISFVLVLWIIKAVEIATGSSFSSLGILPRTLKGITGILTGPLIHGDVYHLLSNTLPILMLGILLFYFYNRIAIEIFIWIYLVSGFWIWLVARDAYHIGASGLVYGMASFLFFSGIIRRSRPLMTVSGIIILLYGGMIYGIFPGAVDLDVSWESHLMGALVGIILAFLFRKTRIDIDQKERHQDLEEKENEKAYFRHSNSTGQDEITYSYKPKDSNKK